MKELPAVAILAGGLAKRLRPITEVIPKSLVEVDGRPFIFHQLGQLKTEGITRVVCCVGYKGEMIESVVGDGGAFGVHVSYSYDGEKLLGTGGAIKKAIKKLSPDFYILYGDSYLQVSYKRVNDKFCREDKKGILTVFRNENTWDLSNVYYRDKQIIAYGKKNRIPEMAYIDYGLSLLKSEVFEGYPEDEEFDLADVYEKLVGEKQLVGFEVTERFYEIGSLKGLKELEAFIKSRKQI